MEDVKKLAVIFPGIGYHTDRPLLYYSKKLASGLGCEIREVPYGNFKTNIKGSPEKMMEAFYNAMAQTEEILKDVMFEEYGNILFISKSIGTAIASAYAGKYNIGVKHILYTPVKETFPFVEHEGIVFHGTSDPWVRTEEVEMACAQKRLDLFEIEGANHSIETGDVLSDLENLHAIMKKTEEYMRKSC